MVEIIWLGHGSFELKLESGEVLLIDPWITGNPKYPATHKVTRVDAILITHGHFDHTGDLVQLAKEHKVPIIAIHEIAVWLESKGVTTARGMNKGGTQQVGSVAVTMTHAVHSSSLSEGGQTIYAGEAAGFVLTFDDGRVAYFAGDTTVFGDMALIAQLYKPTLAFLPIGDYYTMGPREAALACRLIKATTVFPMHWGTFPALTGTPAKLAELLADDGQSGVEVINLPPGETVQW
ncbi:MAG TPA: metal-dependent hydrolase [Bryobacteraceae bacterium]|jgi:L-ascorbate metabolism protein UlaG (beta-lactamase superfamily)